MWLSFSNVISFICLFISGGCCSGPLWFQSAGGSSPAAVSGPLPEVACCRPRAPGARASAVAAQRLRIVSPGLQSAGSGVGAHTGLMPHAVWGLPGPGIEAMSPALAGGFFTTEPQGGPRSFLISGDTGRFSAEKWKSPTPWSCRRFHRVSAKMESWQACILSP